MEKPKKEKKKENLREQWEQGGESKATWHRKVLLTGTGWREQENTENLGRKEKCKSHWVCFTLWVVNGAASGDQTDGPALGFHIHGQFQSLPENKVPSPSHLDSAVHTSMGFMLGWLYHVNCITKSSKKSLDLNFISPSPPTVATFLGANLAKKNAMEHQSKHQSWNECQRCEWVVPLSTGQLESSKWNHLLELPESQN